MPYFITTQKIHTGQTVSLDGDEARHMLLSRRMKQGEKFKLQSDDYQRFEVRVVAVGKNSLTVEILRQVEIPDELPVAVTVYQGYLQEKALDFVLQKSTELGAARLVIFNSANTATKLLTSHFAGKSGRWNKILWEAAKQSGRSRVPELVFLSGIGELVLDAKNLDKIFLCDIAGENFQSHLKPVGLNNKHVGIIVGPEGGFTLPETSQLKQRLPNLELLWLSPFTLRAETAAVSSLAIVQQMLQKTPN